MIIRDRTDFTFALWPCEVGGFARVVSVGPESWHLFLGRDIMGFVPVGRGAWTISGSFPAPVDFPTGTLVHLACVRPDA